MKHLFYLTVLTTLMMTSCTDINERVIPSLGIYRAHVVGLAGPFDLIISADGNDNITIEAPFDGQYWSVVSADLDNIERRDVDVDINRQEINPYITMSGDGFISDRTIQLDYVIDFDGYKEKFRIVGTKY
jgi:hypothetical protein